MCGRARCSLAPEGVSHQTGIPPDRWVDRDKYKPSNNASPGAWTPVVKHRSGDATELHTMKWGLVPSFTKKGEKPDHYRMFNARSETVPSKGVFSRLLPHHRCVVVMNGFYEWKAEGSQKQPYYISFGEDQVLMMAGLYDCFTDESGESLFTYTILTVDSSSSLSWLHNRMPALLPDQGAVDAWLNPDVSDLPGLVQKLCAPFAGPQLTWHPVTKDMNKPGYDKPDAWKDIRQKKGTMSAFFKPLPKKSPAKALPGPTSPTKKVLSPSSSKKQVAATADHPPSLTNNTKIKAEGVTKSEEIKAEDTTKSEEVCKDSIKIEAMKAEDAVKGALHATQTQGGKATVGAESSVPHEAHKALAAHEQNGKRKAADTQQLEEGKRAGKQAKLEQEPNREEVINPA